MPTYYSYPNSNHKIQLPFDDDESSLETPEPQEDAELKWPEPSVSVDDALLDAFKTYVLRLMLTAMVKPSKVLTAMRRLEALREFPLKKEKQVRMLAIAETRIELCRRALDLKEAQLKDRRETREIATAKASAKAVAVAAKAAEKAAKLAEKAAQSVAAVSKSSQPDIQPEPMPETVAKGVESSTQAGPLDDFPGSLGKLQHTKIVARLPVSLEGLLKK